MAKEELENYYKNEGMVIYIKGKPVIMIHPDNLETNIENLSNGNMWFDWGLMLHRVNNTQLGVPSRAILNVKNNND
jgi:hypothetical protein